MGARSIKSTFLVFVLIHSSALAAEPPPEEWRNVFAGGPEADIGTNLIQTRDGGYALTARSNPGPEGVITRTDASGVPIWQQTFGGGAGDLGRSQRSKGNH